MENNVLNILNQPPKLYQANNVANYATAVEDNAPEGLPLPNPTILYDIRRNGRPSFPIHHHETFWSLGIGVDLTRERTLFTGSTWDRIWRFCRTHAGSGRVYLDTIAPLMEQIALLRRQQDQEIPQNFKLLLQIFYYFFSEILRSPPPNSMENIQIANPEMDFVRDRPNPIPPNLIGLTNPLPIMGRTRWQRRPLEELVERFLNIDRATARNFMLERPFADRPWQQIFVNRHISIDVYNLFLSFYHKIMLWALSSEKSNLEKMTLGFDVRNIHDEKYGNIENNPYSLWLKLYMAFIQNLNYRLYKKIIKDSLLSLPSRRHQGNNIQLAIPNEMGNLLYWNCNFSNQMLWNDNPNIFNEINDRNTNVFGPNNFYPNRQFYGLNGEFKGSNINLSKLAGDFIFNLLNLYPRNQQNLIGNFFNVVFNYWSNFEDAGAQFFRGYHTDNVNIHMRDVILALQTEQRNVNAEDEHDREAFGFLVMQLILHKISQKILSYMQNYMDMQDEFDAPFQYVLNDLVIPGELRLTNENALDGYIREVSIVGFKYFGFLEDNNQNNLQGARSLEFIRAFHGVSSLWCDIFTPEGGKNCLMQVYEYLFKENLNLLKIESWENDIEYFSYLQGIIAPNIYNKFINHITNGEVWESLKIYNSLTNIVIKAVLYIYNSNVTIFKEEFNTDMKTVRIILLHNSEIGIIGKNNFDKLEGFRRFAKNWWNFPNNPKNMKKVKKTIEDESGETLEYFDKKNQYVIYGKNEEKNKYKKIIFQKAENGLVEDWGLVEVKKNKKRKVENDSKDEKKYKNVDVWGWDCETVILDYKKEDVWHKYSVYCICFVNLKGDKKLFWGTNSIRDLIVWINDLIKENEQSKSDIKKNGKKYILFYSFNGARFDNIFLLTEFLFYFHLNMKIVGKPENLKCIALWETIFFMDIRLIYTTGDLQKLSRDLLHEQKEEFDIMKVIKSPKLFEENKDDIIKYCFKDCLLVCKLVDITKNFIEKLFKNFNKEVEYSQFKWFQPTISLLSINLWKSLFTPLSSIFGSNDWDLYNVEKSSYKGGMNLPIRREFVSTRLLPFLYGYDIVSSYPYCMKYFAMPIVFIGSKIYENPIRINSGYPLEMTNLYLIRFRFRKDFKIPFLPIRIKISSKLNGLVYLQSNYENPEGEWIWGHEIMIALPYMEIIECFEVKKYKSEFIFYEFIDSLYKERKKAKEEDNNSFAFFLKIVMNSCYGKFGQQKFPYTEIIHGNQFNEYLIGKNLEKFNVVDSDFIQGVKNIIAFTEPIQGSPYFSVNFHPNNDLNFIGGCVRISSYIAACARIRLVQGMLDVGLENVYYFDTDSVFTTKKMSVNMLGDELGLWNLEHNNIIEAYFLNPKVYAFKREDGKIVMKCKGIPQKILKWEMFMDLKMKKESKITNISQIKHLLTNIYFTEGMVKKIKVLDIKRKYYENGDSKPFENINELLEYHEEYLPKILKTKYKKI